MEEHLRSVAGMAPVSRLYERSLQGVSGNGKAGCVRSRKGGKRAAGKEWERGGTKTHRYRNCVSCPIEAGIEPVKHGFRKVIPRSSVIWPNDSGSCAVQVDTPLP